MILKHLVSKLCKPVTPAPRAYLPHLPHLHKPAHKYLDFLESRLACALLLSTLNRNQGRHVYSTSHPYVRNLPSMHIGNQKSCSFPTPALSSSSLPVSHIPGVHLVRIACRTHFATGLFPRTVSPIYVVSLIVPDSFLSALSLSTF
jgi:hypothetical protein